jgi:hypothetical protein
MSVIAMKSLRPGDLVEVKTPSEILQTLDSEGSLNALPFMPEMVRSCGKRFRVARRVVKTCCYVGESTNMRAFKVEDVFTLEDVRCSGDAHDSCPKGCIVFWRDAWLRKVKTDEAPPRVDFGDSTQLAARLKTLSCDRRYFCQASEILNATRTLDRWERLVKCLGEVRAGNCTTLQMIGRVSVWLFWKLRRLIVGEYGRGMKRSTPSVGLGLQPGDWVEVQPMVNIRETLNRRAHNRGLYFSPDMRLLCGTRQRVEKNLDKIIVDGTGEVRPMSNTVFLEGSHCSCPHVAFGGCSRDEYTYWREIWLRRSSASSDPRTARDRSI